MLSALLGGRLLGEIWQLLVGGALEKSGLISFVYRVPLSQNTSLAGWHVGTVFP